MLDALLSQIKTFDVNHVTFMVEVLLSSIDSDILKYSLRKMTSFGGECYAEKLVPRY